MLALSFCYKINDYYSHSGEISIWGLTETFCSLGCAFLEGMVFDMSNALNTFYITLQNVITYFRDL